MTLPALLGSLVLFLALRHRPDPYWEEALGKAERPGLGLMQGLRTGFRDPAASAALRLLFVGNSFVHRNEGAETVRGPSTPAGHCTPSCTAVASCFMPSTCLWLVPQRLGSIQNTRRVASRVHKVVLLNPGPPARSPTLPCPQVTAELLSERMGAHVWAKRYAPGGHSWAKHLADARDAGSPLHDLLGAGGSQKYDYVVFQVVAASRPAKDCGSCGRVLGRRSCRFLTVRVWGRVGQCWNRAGSSLLHVRAMLVSVWRWHGRPAS